MHRLTGRSKRLWKEKLKEWKFEKNVPGKEMKFMAIKAKKRKSEGKETVFHRNKILVDNRKVEHFKKKLKVDEVIPGELDVNIVCFKQLMIIATPPHISYKTPKPNSICDSPSAFSDQGSNVLGFDRPNLLETLVECPGLVDNSSSASIVGQNTELLSLVGDLKLNLESHILEDHQRLETSGLNKQISLNMRESPDHSGAMSISDDIKYASGKDVIQLSQDQMKEADNVEADHLTVEELHGRQWRGVQ